jgi:hypothetical protein
MWITSVVGMFVFVFVISSEASLVTRLIGMVSRHIPKIATIKSYHLFSFRGSVQDYKIHVDTDLVKLFKQYKGVQ